MAGPLFHPARVTRVTGLRLMGCLRGKFGIAATLTDTPRAVAALAAASDGLCTTVLIENVPADIDYVHRVLAQAVGTPA